MDQILQAGHLPDPLHGVIAAAIALAVRYALKFARNEEARTLFGRLLPLEYYPGAAVVVGMGIAAYLAMQAGLSWGAAFAYGAVPAGAMVWHELAKTPDRRERRQSGDYGALPPRDKPGGEREGPEGGG